MSHISLIHVTHLYMEERWLNIRSFVTALCETLGEPISLCGDVTHITDSRDVSECVVNESCHTYGSCRYTYKCVYTLKWMSHLFVYTYVRFNRLSQIGSQIHANKRVKSATIQTNESNTLEWEKFKRVSEVNSKSNEWVKYTRMNESNTYERVVSHLYVWHDSFICVTWLIHMCDMTH